MNNLTVFNTDVIPAYITDTGEKVVIGRELHQKLGKRTATAPMFAGIQKWLNTKVLEK